MADEKSKTDPFAVLGLAPTLEHGAIKRAYFSLLPQHPPHADPEGFRRLRDAYELLMGPGLFDAWAGADVDVDAELEAIERELGDRIAQAQRAWEAQQARQLGILAFESSLRLDLNSARLRLR